MRRSQAKSCERYVPLVYSYLAREGEGLGSPAAKSECRVAERGVLKQLRVPASRKAPSSEPPRLIEGQAEGDNPSTNTSRMGRGQGRRVSEGGADRGAGHGDGGGSCWAAASLAYVSVVEPSARSARPAAGPQGERWLSLARRARWLSWFSLAWMTVEGGVAILAGVLAGSVALIGLGSTRP